MLALPTFTSVTLVENNWRLLPRGTAADSGLSPALDGRKRVVAVSAQSRRFAA